MVFAEVEAVVMVKVEPDVTVIPGQTLYMNTYMNIKVYVQINSIGAIIGAKASSFFGTLEPGQRHKYCFNENNPTKTWIGAIILPAKLFEWQGMPKLLSRILSADWKIISKSL